MLCYAEPVPCLVVRHRKSLINTAENIARVDIPYWHEGQRLSELREGGLTLREIASAIGKSPAYVNFVCGFAKNLHPDLYPRLDAFDRSLLGFKNLTIMAKLVTPEGEPDLQAQSEFLDTLKEHGRAAPRVKYGRSPRAVYKRLQSLDLSKVDPIYRPIINPVLRYLWGETQEIVL